MNYLLRNSLSASMGTDGLILNIDSGRSRPCDFLQRIELHCLSVDLLTDHWLVLDRMISIPERLGRIRLMKYPPAEGAAPISSTYQFRPPPATTQWVLFAASSASWAGCSWRKLWSRGSPCSPVPETHSGTASGYPSLPRCSMISASSSATLKGGVVNYQRLPHTGRRFQFDSLIPGTRS